MRLTALRNIKHNGSRYGLGDAFDASPAQAALLVELGAAEAVQEPQQEPLQQQPATKTATKRRTTKPKR
ncbi:MAG TPA: hypothetical protein VFK80_02875 [Limnochordia bacterium]|nr:hypothetical protein [Limnochordia bacterium]